MARPTECPVAVNHRASEPSADSPNSSDKLTTETLISKTVRVFRPTIQRHPTVEISFVCSFLSRCRFCLHVVFAVIFIFWSAFDCGR